MSGARQPGGRRQDESGPPWWMPIIIGGQIARTAAGARGRIECLSQLATLGRARGCAHNGTVSGRTPDAPLGLLREFPREEPSVSLNSRREPPVKRVAPSLYPQGPPTIRAGLAYP